MVSRKNDQNLLQSIDWNTICVSYCVNQKLDTFRDERRMGNLKSLVSKKKKSPINLRNTRQTAKAFTTAKVLIFQNKDLLFFSHSIFI